MEKQKSENQSKSQNTNNEDDNVIRNIENCSIV